MTFTDLRLAEPIVRAIAEEGYATPTPIQANAVPPAIEGADVLGCAQTGTGKTGAFTFPILHRLSQKKPPQVGRGGRRVPRALILCPTRELASQIFDSLMAYGRFTPLRHCVIFGGVNQSSQVRTLKNGVDVLVATPGRLLDLIEQGYVDLRHIETFVLDEADRMLDMGFIRDIRKIVALVPTKRQTLFFSATMPREIRTLADEILREPVLVEVAPVASTAELISQSVYHLPKAQKPALLVHVLERDDTGRTLIFTRTKHGADKLVKKLDRAGIGAAAIHGNKTQNARTRALAGFKSGRTPILIATDIASRGIDVDDVTHVINYDMPHEPDTYVHRIGRTARAGASGTAISFCDRDERSSLRAIERLIRKKLDVCEPDPDLDLNAPLPNRPRASDDAAEQDQKPQRRRNQNRSGGQGQGGNQKQGSSRRRRPRRDGESNGQGGGPRRSRRRSQPGRPGKRPASQSN